MKGAHPKRTGLDSHLKTLYSQTLVLLFSLSFSQWKAWPASQHVIYLPFWGGLCQIGNISKHFELLRVWMGITTVQAELHSANRLIFGFTGAK